MGNQIPVTRYQTTDHLGDQLLLHTLGVLHLKLPLVPSSLHIEFLKITFYGETRMAKLLQ